MAALGDVIQRGESLQTNTPALVEYAGEDGFDRQRRTGRCPEQQVSLQGSACLPSPHSRI